MELYTTGQIAQVFILGNILGFFIGGLLISKLKSSKVFCLRPVQRKIPSARNTEYPIVSGKNYKLFRCHLKGSLYVFIIGRFPLNCNSNL